MAENKKSFVLYADIIKNIEHLTNEEKGVLFQHLLEYVNDLNPVLEDRLLLTAWKPIETNLKRDLKKYEEKRKQWSEAGKRSAELRKVKKNQRTLTNVEGRSTVSTVNDNVNDNVNVNDINNIYNTFVAEVKNGNHDQAIEQWYMRLKLKKGTLTPLLKNFKGQLIIDNTLHKNTLELRKHFNNWLNIQEKVGKLDEYKKRS